MAYHSIKVATSEQLWPILAYIRPENNNVFPIGIYCGREKPLNSNDLLKDFIDEAKILYDKGICAQKTRQTS